MSPETEKLAKTIVKAVAVRMFRESKFLSPDPEVLMHDPYGVLKEFENAGVDAKTIDAWLMEAQDEDEALHG